jgi:hypothetical protein
MLDLAKSLQFVRTGGTVLKMLFDLDGLMLR